MSEQDITAVSLWTLPRLGKKLTVGRHGVIVGSSRMSWGANAEGSIEDCGRHGVEAGGMPRRDSEIGEGGL